MTKKVFIIAMIACASFTSYAQVEPAAQKLAETQHQQLASDLANSFKSGKGKPVFGREGNDKQFLLKDEEQFFTEYLGWKKSQFDKRNLLSVFQGLMSATKQKDAKKKVSVKITFPLDEAEFKGQVTNKSGKAIKDAYVVTTTAAVIVEAGKEGATKSIAKNDLTLNWEVLLKLNKKTGAVETKASRAVLQSIVVESASGYFASEKQQMQSITEKLIKDYYQSLKDAKWSTVEIPDEWKSTLQASTKRETEGQIVVSAPTSTSFDVRTVPDLKIYVNPDAYHKVALGFKIVINDDLQSGRITAVNYKELEKPRIVEPEPVIEAVVEIKPEPVIEIKPEPVIRERGRIYKVQILSLPKHIALNNLQKRFRMDNVTIEKYIVEGVTYYKYMVSAGSTLSEALAVRRQMRNNGIEDAWIVIYENGARISPNEGQPEIIK